MELNLQDIRCSQAQKNEEIKICSIHTALSKIYPRPGPHGRDYALTVINVASISCNLNYTVRCTQNLSLRKGRQKKWHAPYNKPSSSMMMMAYYTGHAIFFFRMVHAAAFL